MQIVIRKNTIYLNPLIMEHIFINIINEPRLTISILLLKIS